MITPTEKELRAELELMQRQYLTLCDNVRLRGQLIYGNAGNGKAQEAAAQTAELLQAVETAKHQFQMHRERRSAGAYSFGRDEGRRGNGFQQ